MDPDTSCLVWTQPTLCDDNNACTTDSCNDGACGIGTDTEGRSGRCSDGGVGGGGGGLDCGLASGRLVGGSSSSTRTISMPGIS